MSDELTGFKDWVSFFYLSRHPATMPHGRYCTTSELRSTDYIQLLADLALPDETRPAEVDEVWAEFVAFRLTKEKP